MEENINIIRSVSIPEREEIIVDFARCDDSSSNFETDFEKEWGLRRR